MNPSHSDCSGLPHFREDGEVVRAGEEPGRAADLFEIGGLGVHARPSFKRRVARRRPNRYRYVLLCGKAGVKIRRHNAHAATNLPGRSASESVAIVRLLERSEDRHATLP